MQGHGGNRDHHPKRLQNTPLQYNTIQYNTIQYNTIQYSKSANSLSVLANVYCTIQYRAIQLALSLPVLSTRMGGRTPRHRWKAIRYNALQYNRNTTNHHITMVLILHINIISTILCILNMAAIAAMCKQITIDRGS